MAKQHPIQKACARAVSLALVAALLLAPAQSIAYAADAGSTQPQEQQISAFQFKYPAEHTFAEINQFYAEHPYDTSLPDKYDIQPDISNEEINTRIGTDTSALLDAKGKADRDTLAGSLSQETLDNALNATNFMRYSAGLQLLYIHTNDRIGGYQWRAQAGAALLAELNTITHNVDGNEALAAGVVNGVFGWAKAGPGGSNIVAGSGVANKMVNSFMPDIGNDRTGLSHRSYILNPGLSGTGFGAADLSGTTNPKTGKARGSAVAMFVTYYGGDPDNLSAVLWPSRRQPIETFQARGTWQMSYPEGNPYQGNPWSYFINTDSAKVDTSTLKVTLECDGKPTDVLDLNNLTAAEKSENRLFTIGSSPLKRLIAFRPHVAYGAGDKVKVTIEGIVDAQNLPIPVSYDVHFFQTGTEPHPNLEQTAVSRTAADTAEFRFTADYAGTMRYLVLDADAAEPTAEQVLAGSELALGTDPATLDLTSLVGNAAKKLYYITISSTGTGTDYAAESKSGEMSTVKSIDIPEYTAASVNYTVTYDWGNEFPEGVQLPEDTAEYQSVQDAEAAVDKTYTDGFTSNAQKDGKDGTWTFSGWTASVDGNTVTFTGSWSFVEKETPVDPIDPIDPQPPVTPSRPGTTGTTGKPSVRPQPTQSSKPALPFTDVRDGAWYHDAVSYLYENGILSGVREDTFAPNLDTTRGMITTMLHCLEQEPSATAANPFLDAQYGYYAAAVRWAQQKGIVTGTSDTRFSPNAPMTREQLAAVLYRYAQYLGRDTDKTTSLSSFTDGNTVSPYAREAMSWAVAEGILGGVGNDRLAPTAPATRAQVAEILYRFLRAE